MRTNLVIKDDLPHIFEESGNFSMVLNKVGYSLWLRILKPSPQLIFDELEIAEGSSATVAERDETKYRISLLLRLCSATSSGGVANRLSIACTRARRSSVLFLMVTTPCGSIRQTGILSMVVQANFVIATNIEDCHQDIFERAKSTSGIFWGIDGSMGALNYRGRRF